LHEADQ